MAHTVGFLNLTQQTESQLQTWKYVLIKGGQEFWCILFVES